MGNYTEKDFAIDLSNTKNNAQLATELSSILESSETKGKNIILNLGDIDLKQSQLLSIKALIESIESSIGAIITKSDMTEASAVSLGIALKQEHTVNTEFQNSISEHIENLNDTFSSISDSEIISDNIESNSGDINNDNILENPEVKATLNKVLGLPDEDTTKNDIIQTNLELIEPKRFEKRYEETVTNERSSEGKYVLLDTEGITPDDLEETIENTADLQTLYLNQTLRSGQTVTFEGNVLIIGDAHPGSEIIATGDISVWGILGGIAHAGSNGNTSAKVRALKLNPIQLRIAGLYSRRNDTINVPYVQKTNEFTPEEARINNKQIVVYKTLRRED